MLSKYEPLWKWIKKNGKNELKLSFAEIETILGFPIDHSFLTYKKESKMFGYIVKKISMKDKTISFEKS